MNSPASHSPLRWATTHPNRLRDALIEWREYVGTDAVLDLRANAYGFGDTTVASVAAELGVQHAALDAAGAVDGGSSDGPNADWVDIAHRHHAMSLQAQVVNSKDVPAGAEVSYGGYYQTAEPTTLALIAIGFADGLPRLDPVGGQVALGDRRLSIAGRIAMDQIIVDSGQYRLEPGQVITIWGETVSCADWSDWSGRSCAVLGAGLGERVVRMVEDR